MSGQSKKHICYYYDGDIGMLSSVWWSSLKIKNLLSIFSLQLGNYYYGQGIVS